MKFINEGVLGWTIGLLLGFLGIPYLIVGGCIASAKISEHRISSKVRNALKQAIQKNSELKEFDNKIKRIKFISIDELINRMDIEQKDKSAAKYGTVVCAVMEDKNNNIMAYAVMYDDSTEYAFYIVDKSFKKSKLLNDFVKANFELHFGIIGPGIKKFVDMDTDYINSKRFSKASGFKLTDSERIDVLKSSDDLANSIYSELKNKLSNFYIELSNDDYNYNNYNHTITIMPEEGKKYPLNDNEKILKILMSILDSHNFINIKTEYNKYDISVYSRESTEYPYLKIIAYIYQIGDGYGCEIYINIKKNINK